MATLEKMSFLFNSLPLCFIVLGLQSPSWASMSIETVFEIQTSVKRNERLVLEEVKLGKGSLYFAKLRVGSKTTTVITVPAKQFAAWSRDINQFRKSARRPSCSQSQELIYEFRGRRETTKYCQPVGQAALQEPMQGAIKQIRTQLDIARLKEGRSARQK